MIPLFLVGCGVGVPDGATVVRELDASAAARTGEVVGVTVDPDSGDWLVLGSMDGLFRVDGDALAPLAGPGALTDQMFGDLRPYTDVAALGGGRVAFTVARDGFLFDASEGTTKRHFCYEPGDGGDWVVDYQVTDSLAFDPERALILANPQSLSDDGPFASEVATFDAETGAPQVFDPLDDVGFRAGGLAPDGDRVLLASETTIYAQHPGDPDRTALADLAALGIRRIDGFVLDPATGDAIVADGARSRIVVVRGWR